MSFEAARGRCARGLCARGRNLILSIFIGLAAAGVVFRRVRRAGWHMLVRRTVSPLGGSEIAFRLVRQLLFAIFAFLGRLEVQGAENVPPSGPLLIASNHVSDADPPVIFAALPRWAWFVGKEELFTIPLIGPVLRCFHGFPIRHTGPADYVALRRIFGLLAKGEAVVMFPEGELSETGCLQPFHRGIAMISLRTGVPVVPAAISGTQRMVPYGRVLPRPARGGAVVRFGKPLDLSQTCCSDHHQRLDAATARIHDAVAGLLKEVDRERMKA